MKKLIAFVSVLALQVTPAMAWVGGPWSAGTHDNHVTGIFGGIITMKNGSGIFRFSSDESAQLGAFNSSVVYYKGRTFLGSCLAHIDFQSKSISGITNGSAYDRSPTQRIPTTSPLVDHPVGGGGQISVPLTPIINPDDNEVTPRNYNLAGLTATGPVGIANTQWEGKLTSTAPNIRFSAKGEAAFVGASDLVFDIRIDEVPNEDPALPPSLNGITIGFGGNNEFPDPENTEKIRVFGSRVTYNVSPSAGGLNNSITGTGGGAFSF